MWEYSDNNTFRMGPIEVVKDAKGTDVRIRECQELVGGRWEPFISIVGPCDLRLAGQGHTPAS